MRELELLLQYGRGGTTGNVSVLNAAEFTSVLQCTLKSRGSVIQTVSMVSIIRHGGKNKSSLLFKTDFMLCRLHPVSWIRSQGQQGLEMKKLGWIKLKKKSED